MTHDTTKTLPDGNDRIDQLIVMVQTVSTGLQDVRTDLQDVRTDLQDVKARLSTLENTVGERLYDTRPIWERALAEIAETRSEITEVRSQAAEIRSQLTEIRSEMEEGFYKLGDKMDVLNEGVLDVRAENRRLKKRVDNLEPKTP